MEKYMSGLNKKSFSLPYNGGEIWCEHLDSLCDKRELLLEKFRKDLVMIAKPSTSSFIAVNLDETDVDRELIDTIFYAFLSMKKSIRNVVFVGLSPEMKRYAKRLSADFVVNCLDDFEKAKEWLL